jgi:ADP-heptose:LPS heptosyltransferase
MKILIAPYCKAMRNGKPHPKNFPYWGRLIQLMLVDGHEIIQLGVEGEKELVPDFRKNVPFKELKELIKDCDLFVSVDTWLHHAAHHYGRRGIVIFSQSNPLIFGYPENINLLKHKKYLRHTQFWLWEQAEYNQDAFVRPEVVINSIRTFTNNGSNQIAPLA